MPARAVARHDACFPVYWTLPYQTKPTLDYFHKYVVTEVDVQDPDALSPNPGHRPTPTSARPAWHYDDNEVVKPANRTYGQFRGYRRSRSAPATPRTLQRRDRTSRR